MKKLAFFVLAAISLSVIIPAPAMGADTSEGVDSVRAALVNLIRALVDEGLLSALKAQDMLRQAGIDPAVLAAPQVSQMVPAPAEPRNRSCVSLMYRRP